MRILIESSNTNHNWGDASMLEVALHRLSRFFPGAEIVLLNHETDALSNRHPCSETVVATQRKDWERERRLWDPLNRRIPHTVDQLHMCWPHVWKYLSTFKMKLQDRHVAGRDAFLARVEQADLLVVSGGGFITDLFGAAGKALSLIQLAHRYNVPVVMFGQGIGPIEDPRLLKRARFTLPHVDLIALREDRFSHPLLCKLGVPESNIMVTGDDAVALAYPERPEVLGGGIGVNLRVASYSEVQAATAAALAEVLREAAQDLDAPLRPVPIAFEGRDSDVETIRHVLDQCDVNSDGGAALESPHAVIRQVGRCRVVVTGSYHGGVFALSQGTPVVALSRSDYYDHKFLGLADQFGTGCTVLRTDRHNFRAALREAIYTAWEQAKATRPALLAAARQQIEAAEDAYRKAAQLVGYKAEHTSKITA